MVYDLSDSSKGVRDCPKCRHTMERLKHHNAQRRNEGYLLDYGEPRAALWIFDKLFGLVGTALVRLYHYTLYPLHSKQRGDQRRTKYARILDQYPNSLICPYCGHILKQK